MACSIALVVVNSQINGSLHRLGAAAAVAEVVADCQDNLVVVVHVVAVAAAVAAAVAVGVAAVVVGEVEVVAAVCVAVCVVAAAVAAAAAAALLKCALVVEVETIHFLTIVKIVVVVVVAAVDAAADVVVVAVVAVVVTMEVVPVHHHLIPGATLLLSSCHRRHRPYFHHQQELTQLSKWMPKKTSETRVEACCVHHSSVGALVVCSLGGGVVMVQEMGREMGLGMDQGMGREKVAWLHSVLLSLLVWLLS